MLKKPRRRIVNPCPWDDEMLQKIYQSWGRLYFSRKDFNLAIAYLTRALELNAYDIIAYKLRSISYASVAKFRLAQEDAKRADELETRLAGERPYYNLEYCDALFDEKLFEKYKLELANATKVLTGVRGVPYYERKDIIDEYYEDILGANAGPCLVNLRKIIKKIGSGDDMNKKPTCWDDDIDDDAEDYSLSILSKARREKKMKVLCQKYLGRSWLDVDFINELNTEKRLILPEAANSGPKIKVILDDISNNTKEYLKLLEAGSPLYTKERKLCVDPVKRQQIREGYLYNIQYQTRRDVFYILEKAKELRKTGQLDKLIKYTEDIMCNYIGKKTIRVLPIFLEFINEYYNNLALAFSDKYVVPINTWSMPLENRIFYLLGVKPSGSKAGIPSVIKFGDKTGFKIPEEQLDTGFIAYKTQMDKIERRVPHCIYEIEKCYFFHELARLNLKLSKLDESRIMAKKLIHQAEVCNHNLWKFLGELLNVKADIIQYNRNKRSYALYDARKTAYQLKSVKLLHFVEVCIQISETEDESKPERMKSETSTDDLEKSSSEEQLRAASLGQEELQKKLSKDYKYFRKLSSELGIQSSENY